MKFLFITTLSLCLAACAGYKLGPIPPTEMKEIRTIAVPTFKNDTLEPRIEVLIADTVIKQIQQDGTYKIASKEKADAILKGKILTIIRQPVRSVRGNVLATREFNLYLGLEYTLLRQDTGELITTRTVTGTSSFFVGSDIQQEERQAIPLAAEDAAVQLVTQISEGW